MARRPRDSSGAAEPGPTGTGAERRSAARAGLIDEILAEADLEADACETAEAGGPVADDGPDR
jgi:hypothetical protein